MQAGHLGAPSSYLAAFSGTPVLAVDGTLVGSLMHVLTSAPGLDGIVIEAEVGGGGARFVDARAVEAFYERGVTLVLTPEACAALPRPEPPPASDAGEVVATGIDAKLRRAWEVLAGEDRRADPDGGGVG